MTAEHTITLPEKVSEQKHGIVLVWSAYSNNNPQDYGFNYFFIPKSHVKQFPGCGVSMIMTNTGSFSYIAVKYCYINNETISGNDNNIKEGTSSGITYNNSAFVLRSVIGV